MPNAVLGFLASHPQAGDARGTVTGLLRWLGILLLAAYGWFVVSALWMAVLVQYLNEQRFALTAFGTPLLVALVVGAIVTVAGCAWITHAVRAWSSGAASGPTHVLALGIVALVLAAWSIVSIRGAPTGTQTGSLAFAIVQLVLGVLLLVNRTKALAPAPDATGAPTRT